MIDLTTSAGALRFAELRRNEMSRCFQRLGRYEANGVSFSAVVFATHAVKGKTRTGAKLPHVTPQLCLMPREYQSVVPGERHTEVFAEVLRDYVKITRALAVLVMNEMWHVRKVLDPDRSIDEQRAEMTERLADEPLRREVLAMWIAHPATGHRYWQADILREPSARLTPWVSMPSIPVGGSLVDVLDEVNGWRN